MVCWAVAFALCVGAGGAPTIAQVQEDAAGALLSLAGCVALWFLLGLPGALLCLVLLRGVRRLPIRWPPRGQDAAARALLLLAAGLAGFVLARFHIAAGALGVHAADYPPLTPPARWAALLGWGLAPPVACVVAAAASQRRGAVPGSGGARAGVQRKRPLHAPPGEACRVHPPRPAREPKPTSLRPLP